MSLRRKLACSFCGRNAAEVSKLVAGSRGFICDACAATAHRIMSDPSVGAPVAPRVERWTWRRLLEWWRNAYYSALPEVRYS